MSERLSDEQIEALERLEREATPGPWDGTRLAFDPPEATEKDSMKRYVTGAIDKGGDEYFAVLCEKPDGRADVCHTGNGPTSGWNAMLIGTVRTALPLLLAEVRASRAPREDDPRDALAPWYEADGSTVMLPAAEVERRRKAAAKVLHAAEQAWVHRDPVTMIALGDALRELHLGSWARSLDAKEGK